MSTTVRIKTDYGLKVIATKNVDTAMRLAITMDVSFLNYYRRVYEMQMRNCGWCITDERCGDPVDNEYDLEVIYGILKERSVEDGK